MSRLGVLVRQRGTNMAFDTGSKFKELALSDLTRESVFAEAHLSDTTVYQGWAYATARLWNENRHHVMHADLEVLTIGELFRFNSPPDFNHPTPDRKYCKTWTDFITFSGATNGLMGTMNNSYNFIAWKTATPKPQIVTEAHWEALADPRASAANLETWTTAFNVENLNYSMVAAPTPSLFALCCTMNSLCGYGYREVYPNLLRKLWITSFISFLKRGECTPHFIRKNVEGFEGWFPQNVELLGSTIKTVYQVYGSSNNDETMRLICEHMLRFVPVTVVRARNSIDQCQWYGLAAYNLIVETISTHRSFYWRRLFSIREYTTEWNNFQAACTDVRRNAYYGFKRDLGNARSTNFLNLASICKRILMKCDANVSLDGLRSVPDRFKYQVQVDQWIETYQNNRVSVNLEGIGADHEETFRTMSAILDPLEGVVQ